MKQEILEELKESMDYTKDLMRECSRELNKIGSAEELSKIIRRYFRLRRRLDELSCEYKRVKSYRKRG